MSTVDFNFNSTPVFTQSYLSFTPHTATLTQKDAETGEQASLHIPLFPAPCLRRGVGSEIFASAYIYIDLTLTVHYNKIYINAYII